MIFLEAGNNLHLRPAQLLLMIYRYASGIYQTGEISALSYTKGYLDHQGASNSPCRVLTVSSHGIGEAETWMVERLEDAIVEKDWSVVEQAVEVLRSMIDNPFDGYDKDIDIEEY